MNAGVDGERTRIGLGPRTGTASRWKLKRAGLEKGRESEPIVALLRVKARSRNTRRSFPPLRAFRRMLREIRGRAIDH